MTTNSERAQGPRLRLLTALYAAATGLAGALIGALVSAGCENLDAGTGHYWVCEVLNDYGGTVFLIAAPVLAVLLGASRARDTESLVPLHRAAIAAAVGVVGVGLAVPLLAVALWPS